MNKYTAEEAMKILKLRGFDKPTFTYELMFYDGTYINKGDIRSKQWKLEIQDNGRYIDCGHGFLWHLDYKDCLHKGTCEYLEEQEQSHLTSKFKSNTFEELLSKLEEHEKK